MAAYVKHPSAIVDDGAILGEGTRVWHFSHVAGGARIGRDCVLGQNVYVASTAVLGDNVHVQNNVSIYDGVTIEDHVFLGPSMVFTNVLTPRSEFPRKGDLATTRVGRGASIGANATIVCGHEIGSYAMVGAGSVLTADVPAFALVFGVPARQAAWVCRCGMRLAIGGSSSYCAACGRAYRLHGSTLVEA